MAEGTPTLEQLAEHHEILRDDFASEWMGIRVVEIADGRAVITMDLRREMLNGFGMAHGGMIFAFADTAFALACNDMAGSDETITVASGADITFLRSAQQGQTLTATAVRRATAGRSGLYDVTITASAPSGEDSPDGEDLLIAEFRGRSRTIPQPSRRRR
ncbi:phenylacetic acid degradation protein [Tersicoccus phoenicis]|uniref:Phenylacetic acid degradation protein n=1 Tax=Tersicoccus phoenicis TaxID=554083 RepID=A0A1R1LPD0_9MICC|nr:hotdog fold thioesterase [Tersicoccus phoenicis]OMH29334.1 phenylacetic acid degradation protein [Tersicoccus phoenicis]